MKDLHVRQCSGWMLGTSQWAKRSTHHCPPEVSILVGGGGCSQCVKGDKRNYGGTWSREDGCGALSKSGGWHSSPEGRRRGARKTPDKVPQAERTAAGTAVIFAGYRMLIFLVQLLNNPGHCLVASTVSDEKSARNFIKVLFFIIKLFIFIINLMRNFIKVLLSSCFQDSVHVFGFWQLDYDACSCGSLWVYLIWASLM